MRPALAMLVFAAGVAAACSRQPDFDASSGAHPQTFADAMRIVCEIPSRPSITALPQDQRATAIAAEVARDVTNPEVKTYFASAAPVPREQRERELRAMLARAHIASCWLVDGP